MAQLLDHATLQLYRTYHQQVFASRDTHTYDHFSSGKAREMRQEALLTTYMQEMVNALLADVNTRGDCWLLRAIVTHELPAIHLLDHSAIAYVYATLFTPEEAPRLDTRSIPYTSGWSRSAGGMLYSDKRARSCIIDLRSSDVLHLLCHALLMYAAQKTQTDDIRRLTEEKNALNSRITQLNDQILGLQRELAAATVPAPAAPEATETC